MKRQFAAGAISKKAAKNYLGDYGRTTSDNREALTKDDGGVSQKVGGVRNDHVTNRRQTGYRRGNGGFSQPSDKDFGPGDSMSGAGHIDDRRSQQPKWNRESGYNKQRDRSVLANTSRVRAGSAFEYFPASWYGHPSKRG
jgi:hypothetical protein